MMALDDKLTDDMFREISTTIKVRAANHQQSDVTIILSGVNFFRAIRRNVCLKRVIFLQVTSDGINKMDFLAYIPYFLLFDTLEVPASSISVFGD